MTTNEDDIPYSLQKASVHLRGALSALSTDMLVRAYEQASQAEEFLDQYIQSLRNRRVTKKHVV